MHSVSTKADQERVLLFDLCSDLRETQRRIIAALSNPHVADLPHELRRLTIALAELRAASLEIERNLRELTATATKEEKGP